MVSLLEEGIALNARTLRVRGPDNHILWKTLLTEGFSGTVLYL